MKRFSSVGATLTELITVIVLLGIVSVFAAARFFSKSDFDERGFFELAIQATRYAQKVAIASGCDVRVQFTATSYALHEWINAGSCVADSGGSGLTLLQRPGSGDFTDTAPDGVSVGSAMWYFDAIGRPREASGGGFGNLIASATSVAIGSRTLTVEPETGFVRCTAGC
ncbi:MAG: type II secretion system protein [Gammaproteobacteria bacterium]|nr:type II secretion system protein [Gammaproteobacteria bacterium]